MNKENINNEDGNLREDAPILFGLKKEEPYAAPDGYFEKFQSELPVKIHTKKPNWWNIIVKPIVWAPAMVILIVSSIFLLKGDDSTKTNKTASTITKQKLNDLSFDVLDSYVNEHLLAQVNTDELMEIVGEDNIPSLGKNHQTENKTEVNPTIEHIQEDEMEEYIMENMDELDLY